MGACSESCKAHGDLFAIKRRGYVCETGTGACGSFLPRRAYIRGTEWFRAEKKVFRVEVTLHPSFPDFA